ncbi:N(2),N(2)-dimethylguanosine tRNA methyltransferase [Hydrogenobacter hydrogenophilus]|uniref:tRNA (guanine(26)-N(2)/guanine(27)-N(2))-dimethyltransferase n=1 Tax=Hydrogenobacter hydrogenophilus TaxID=35835 RepID=A0A285NYZ5_9AQUI|nr:N(2),N(2)-dimethylguanosine tRNA methyltransferase [Hydrogenobacter hydrogenophilus]
MIQEGKARLHIQIPSIVSSRMPVFYNPHMVINRDMSLLVVLASVGEGAIICDPMGASGIRGIRFLLEAGAKKVIYNDINPMAVEEFKRLIKINCVDESKVEIYSEDASLLLRKLRGFDYVDIDPFGSPVDFLESAILSVKRGGLLGVSATDTAVLSGTYPTTCIRRYGSKPLLEAEFYHEVGIRILIKKVVEEGAKLDCALTPVFCYSYRHHFKVFLRKDIGARRADQLMRDIGYIVYCSKCLYRKALKCEGMINICPICGNELLYAGPLWIGKLWNEELITGMQKPKDRLILSKETIKLLSKVQQEATKQTVGFYTLSAIGEKLRIGSFPNLEKFLPLIEGVRTHFTGEGFRTTLSHSELLKRLGSLSLRQ